MSEETTAHKELRIAIEGLRGFHYQTHIPVSEMLAASFRFIGNQFDSLRHEVSGLKERQTQHHTMISRLENEAITLRTMITAEHDRITALQNDVEELRQAMLKAGMGRYLNG